MNCIKRGWLYTTRKKGKSFLLFCILFLIAVFVLSALAIDKASSLAQDNLRKSLGGEFTIGYDYSEANPYLNVGKRSKASTLKIMNRHVRRFLVTIVF